METGVGNKTEGPSTMGRERAPTKRAPEWLFFFSFSSLASLFSLLPEREGRNRERRQRRSRHKREWKGSTERGHKDDERENERGKGRER